MYTLENERAMLGALKCTTTIVKRACVPNYHSNFPRINRYVLSLSFFVFFVNQNQLCVIRNCLCIFLTSANVRRTSLTLLLKPKAFKLCQLAHARTTFKFLINLFSFLLIIQSSLLGFSLFECIFFSSSQNCWFLFFLIMRLFRRRDY